MESPASDSGTMPANQPRQSINLDRILWVGPLTVLASVGAVVLIRAVAVAILHSDAMFEPFTPYHVIFDSVIGAAGAVFVFWQTCQYSLKHIRFYRKLAAGVLFISLGPDAALALGHWFGGGWPEAFALASMHVVVWAICVTILPLLVATKSS